MLTELHVRGLGVIADLDVVLGPGLTAITGETGAGKTLVIEALELLVGGRADPTVVRAGASEAVVEGRFVEGDDAESELVVSRTVPAEGRSRGSLNGQMAALVTLEDSGARLVDLYGQHAHQSLLRPAVQRQALDSFAGVDLTEVGELRHALAELDRRVADLGGDERARSRERDLLAFELAEIEQAAPTGAREDDELAEEEGRLAEAVQLREAAAAAYAALEGEDSGALTALGAAIEALGRHEALVAHRERLNVSFAELSDAAGELRRDGEGFAEDPERLAAVRDRRELLHRLVRKHGDDLAAVLAAAEATTARLAELDSTEGRRAELAEERKVLVAELAAVECRVGDLRRAKASELATRVEANLAKLALPGARLSVAVGADGIGDDVEFLISTNRGEPLLPLAKIASGGELARAMLALRLVLSSAPPTLVFDEVDAGIGGAAALAVGAALAELGTSRQVLVVTHLAQVAAHADRHLVLEKSDESGRTVSSLRAVQGEERVIELSRMLSGHPDSAAARKHASELLATSGRADR